jgi:hypothetical protein
MAQSRPAVQGAEMAGNVRSYKTRPKPLDAFAQVRSFPGINLSKMMQRSSGRLDCPSPHGNHFAILQRP